MSTWTADVSLRQAGEMVAAQMDFVRKLFKPGARITVAVRFAQLPERDFLMTDDDLAEVAAMIERRRRADSAEVES